MTQKYMFIDGAFLQGYLQEMKELIKLDGEEVNIQFEKIGQGFHRIFYYDAYPEWDERGDPDKKNYERELNEADERFSKISRVQNFHVRPA